jgi:hypothetical protein
MRVGLSISQFPDFPITRLLNFQSGPQMSRDVGDLGDPSSLCHFDRCRSIREGERGTPRMFAADMLIQGILSRIPWAVRRACPERREAAVRPKPTRRKEKVNGKSWKQPSNPTTTENVPSCPADLPQVDLLK